MTYPVQALPIAKSSRQRKAPLLHLGQTHWMSHIFPYLLFTTTSKIPLFPGIRLQRPTAAHVRDHRKKGGVVFFGWWSATVVSTATHGVGVPHSGRFEG